MKKLNAREYCVIQDALLNNLILNLDYIKDTEKAGKNPLFTTGYVIRETKDLLNKLLDGTLKSKHEYCNLEGEKEFLLAATTKYCKD